MPKTVFYATGFFEIGDEFMDDTGKMRTITDVLVCHYIRRGSYKVLYEVDNSGEFIDLVIRNPGEAPGIVKKQTKPKEEKPGLRLTDLKKKTSFEN